MGLRCTIFGHGWGEPEVERDREEDGEEVVVTVREVRTCNRCGAEDVLGESMEVTAIEPPDADVATPPAEGSPGPPEEEPVDETARDPETDDGVILDEDDQPADGEREPGEWPGRPEHDGEDEGGEPSEWPDTATPDEGDPDEERFVGVDAEADDPTGAEPDATPPADAERSEATERGDAERSEATERGDAERSESTGRSDAERSEGAEVLDGTADEDGAAAGPEDGSRGRASGAADTGDARTGGDASERDDPATAGGADAEPEMGDGASVRPDDDAEVLETTEPNEQSQVTAEEPVDPTSVEGGGAGDDPGVPEEDRSPTGGGRNPGPGGRGPPADEDAGAADDGSPLGDDPDLGRPAPDPDARQSDAEDVEYFCPECGYVDDSKWPSRRAGDVCPDCGRSYLDERPS